MQPRATDFQGRFSYLQAFSVALCYGACPGHLSVSPLGFCRGSGSQAGGLGSRRGRWHVCVCVASHLGSHGRASAEEAFIHRNAAIYSYRTALLKRRRSWFKWGWDWMLQGAHSRRPCLSVYKPKLREPRALNLPFSPVSTIQYY